MDTLSKREMISQRVAELVQERYETLETYDRADQLQRTLRDGTVVGERLIGFDVQFGDYHVDPAADTAEFREVFITLEALTALYTQAHADVEAGRIDGAMGGGR